MKKTIKSQDALPFIVLYTGVILLIIIGIIIGIAIHIIISDETKLKNEQIYILSEQIKELKSKKAAPGFIQIGDTTLFVVTGKPDRHEHKKPINPGKNNYDFTVDENTRFELIVWKNLHKNTWQN